MAGKNQHLVRCQEGWVVRGKPNTRDTSHGTLADAVDAVRDIACNQRSEVVVHDRRRRVRDRGSCGDGPNPPTDRVHCLAGTET